MRKPIPRSDEPDPTRLDSAKRGRRRVVGLFLATACAVAVVLSAALVMGSTSTTTESSIPAASTRTPASDLPTITPTAPASGSSSRLQLGVQVFSMWRDWDDHAELMDQVAASGARWIRVDVGWCSLEEGGPGVISPWYLDRLDQTVSDARARGLSLLVTLTCSPTWARSDGDTLALPDDPAQYGRVAKYLATRYQGRIKAWELWNEPDCQNLRCGEASPEQYLPVLRAGYRGIKAGDPSATVTSGGISGVNIDWLRRLLADGGGRYMDALAVNPYIAPAYGPPNEAPAPGNTDPYRLTNLPAAHELLVDAGYADMPIWLTEFGWSTGRTVDPDSVYEGVSESTQAAYLTEAVDLVRSQYPYVTRAFWFCLRDRDDASRHENGYGLLTLDGTHKPSYAAFAQAVAAHGD